MRLLVAALVLMLSALSIPSGRAQTSLDPDTVREATALMSRFDMAGLMRQQLAASQQHMRAMLASGNLGKDAEDLATKYFGKLQAKFQEQMPIYIEEATLIYARQFTLDELKQINLFYDSPVGQLLIRKTPEIVRECSELSARTLTPLVQEMFSEMKAEVEKRRANQVPK